MYQKLQAEYYKRFPEELKSEFMTDFPTAWKCLDTKKENHHVDCSWQQGLLCDCAGQDVFIKTIGYVNESIGKPLTLAGILRMVGEDYHTELSDTDFIIATDEKEPQDGLPYWGIYIELPLNLDPKDYPEETLLEICNLLDI